MKKLSLIIALSMVFPVYADELSPNFFHIVFNKAKDTNKDDVTSVYFIKGYYYISKKDSESFGVVFDDNDLFALNGDLYVNLNNIGRIKENGSELLIDTDPNKLEPSVYNLKIQNQKNKREFTNSSHLNYSVTSDLKNKTNNLNTSFFKTFDNGVLYNINTNISESKEGNKLNVLDLYREQYFQENLSKLRIGSSYSSGGSLINPASFIGVQFKKDFNIDSNYLKNPYLSASGTADVKSNAEIYVNDKFVSSTSLNPGPYTINNISSGQTSNNDVKVVVKDVNGNLVQVNNISLIGSSYNLKKGENNYSFDVGQFRNGYNDLGDGFISGTYSYGINDQFTIEGHIEGSSEQKRASINSTLATKIGTFQYGIAKGSNETLQKLQYNYQNGNFYTNGYILKSNNFHSFGNTSRIIPNQSALTLGYRLNDWNFFINGAKVDENNRYNLGFSKNIGAANLYFALNRQNDQNGFFVNLSMPLGDSKDWRISQLATKTDGKNSYDLNINKFANYDGIGINADISRNDNENNVAGTVYKNSQYGNLSLYGNTDSNQVILKGEGSIVFDNGVHFSKPIYEGYAIVNAEQANVPIMLNNNTVAKTGKDGIAIIPGISQYSDNKINIDMNSMSEELSSDNEDIIISPLNHFKADIKFKVKKNPVLLSLGIPLKELNKVTISDKEFLVLDNYIYFDDYKPNESYKIHLNSCSVTFKIPEKIELNQIIPLKCE